ncbi:hypothetical protein LT85_3295 [Collimonas arenae]|uniref:Uncharacterized protein n=1 Tax=Collimonas arenae TaxID=279058 RepID=A0A0A1FCH3_9BURK|nr:hypothetical protein LT85_3295 [Collimonas arenae]
MRNNFRSGARRFARQFVSLLGFLCPCNANSTSAAHVANNEQRPRQKKSPQDVP